MSVPAAAVAAARHGLIEELEKLARKRNCRRLRSVRLRTCAGEHVSTSGHLPYYAESMFPPMTLVEEEKTPGTRPLFRDVRDKNRYTRGATRRRPDRWRNCDSENEP
jgi:hypothetical protein